MHNQSANIQEFEQALLTLDKLRAQSLLNKSIENASSEQASKILEKIIVSVMERIGSGWEKGDIALSQVYMSGRICEELIKKISEETVLTKKDTKKTAIVVLEDRHMLGQRIVYSILLASGFSLLNYGSMSVNDLVERIKNDKVEIILVSTLMLPSALRIRELKEKLNGTGVKIVVGGAPFRFDDKLWQEVGADAVGANASEAINIMYELNKGRIEKP